jgi:hypothetical protein
VVTIGDAILVLGFLFSGGRTPSPPFPDLGRDPTPDDGLECQGWEL